KVSVTLIATRFDKNPNRLFQKQKPVEELVLDEQPCDINLEDEGDDFEQLFEKELKKQPQRAETIKRANSTKKPKKKKSRELVSEQTQEGGATDSWFQRQFNRFFEDQDEEIEK